jgi:hypothetical protein
VQNNSQNVNLWYTVSCLFIKTQKPPSGGFCVLAVDAIFLGMYVVTFNS